MHPADALSVAVLLALLLVPGRPVPAQVLVYDALNHEAGIHSGLQEFLGVVQNVLQTGHMISELTPMVTPGWEISRPTWPNWTALSRRRTRCCTRSVR